VPTGADDDRDMGMEKENSEKCDAERTEHRRVGRLMGAPWSCWTQRLSTYALVVPLLVLMSGWAISREIDQIDVRALVGTKIPDEPRYSGPGWQVGSISKVVSEWVCLGGERSGDFVVEPCYRRDGATALVTRRHASPSPGFSIVVDALVVQLSGVRLPFEVKKELRWNKKSSEGRRSQYAYSSCRAENVHEHKPIIIALVYPEPGMNSCAHFTRRIRQVWKLDKQSERMALLSPDGVSCWWNACLLENSCQNEDQCNTP